MVCHPPTRLPGHSCSLFLKSSSELQYVLVDGLDGCKNTGLSFQDGLGPFPYASVEISDSICCTVALLPRIFSRGLNLIAKKDSIIFLQ